MKDIFFAAIVVMSILATDGVGQTLQVSQWITNLSHGDTPTRRMAAYNLGTGGADCAAALPALNKALKDPDELVAIFAAQSILETDQTRPEDAAIDFLIETVNSEVSRNALHNDNAIEALGQGGPRAQKAIPLLTQIANSASGGTKLNAERALSRIQGQ
jgi:HEAT repeat protein